jgi:hypothetical protein
VFVGANCLHARGAEAGGQERFETLYRVGAGLLYQGLGFRVWGWGFGIRGLFWHEAISAHEHVWTLVSALSLSLSLISIVTFLR